MPDELDDLNPNPIVAMAMRIRARRDLGTALEGGDRPAESPSGADAAASLAAFAEGLQRGNAILSSVLGREGVTFVRLEKPLRIRLRFSGKRVTLDLDEARQLLLIGGLELDGEYQFVPDAPVPALINVSRLSTESGYGEALTPSELLKRLTAEAELPRPPHLDSSGPLVF